MITLSKLRGPISWSILSILIILTYGMISIANSFSPLLERSTNAMGDSQEQTLLEQHDMLITMDIARFEGRSAFFKPIRK